MVNLRLEGQKILQYRPAAAQMTIPEEGRVQERRHLLDSKPSIPRVPTKRSFFRQTEKQTSDDTTSSEGIPCWPMPVAAFALLKGENLSYHLA
jgi:hypothetical protein